MSGLKLYNNFINHYLFYKQMNRVQYKEVWEDIIYMFSKRNYPVAFNNMGIIGLVWGGLGLQQEGQGAVVGVDGYTQVVLGVADSNSDGDGSA